MEDNQFLIYKTPSPTISILKEFVLNDKYGVLDTDEFQTISKTNWPNASRDEINDHEFLDLFHKVYWKDYTEWLYSEFPYIQNPKVHNIWYQVYESEDSHDWHIHEDCHIANIIYLQLQDDSLITQFKLNDQILVPQVKEGDTLVFNPYYTHRSPINTTSTTKIIISFNISYELLSNCQ